jgi:preprotein translocase subunit SecE
MVKKRKKRTPKKSPTKGAASLGLDSAATEPEDGTPALGDAAEEDDPFAPSADDADHDEGRGQQSAADGERQDAEDEADGASDQAAEDSDEAAPRDGDSAALAAGAPDAAAETEGEQPDGAPVATQLGAARYVIFGVFASWIIGSYVASKTLQGVWSWLSRKEWFGRTLPSFAALPHEGELVSRSSISLLVGAIVAAVVVFVYYRKPDVRQWADEVAEQLGKVKWPTRKDVGNYTVVVLAVSAVLTVYLALLDRFWGFLTNLIYSSGL